MNNIEQKIRDLNEEIARIDNELAVWKRLPRWHIGDSRLARLKERMADCLQARLLLWMEQEQGKQ